MTVADGKFLAEMEGEVYFPWDVAWGSHRGPVLNSLHFITQTKIEDVNHIRQKQKKIKVGFVLITASLPFHIPVAGHSSVHTPTQKEITVF